MKKIISTLILIFIISCSKGGDKNELIIKYPNSNLVYKEIKQFIEYDSVFYFYENSSIFKYGKQRKDGKPFDKWYLYDKNGNLREIREWFVINGHSRINQNWYLSELGDTLNQIKNNKIYKQREFINDTIGHKFTKEINISFIKDTFQKNEPFRAFVYLPTSLLNDKKSEAIVFLGEFNDDFSNFNTIKLDTFYNLKHYKYKSKRIPKNLKMEYFVPIKYDSFLSPGDKTIKGFITEYAEGNFENKYSKLEHKTYFQKKIYVK